MPNLALTAKDFNREEFIAWLESLPPNDSLPTIASSSVCPLDRWLGNDESCVDVITYFHAGFSFELPEWAKEFVHSVDFSSLDDCQDIWDTITATECLNILLSIKAA